MAINSDIRDQAYEFFVEEAPELLQTIESGLLSLRQERDKNTIHSIMRAAHSLKGGSASVGLDAIKTISHRVEAIFKSLYSDTLTIDSELETQLLAAYDCLRIPLHELFETGQFETEAALDTAEEVLAPLEVRCCDAIAETRDFVPGSADLGVNMAISIFEVDVAEGIQRLEMALATTPADIGAELRAQAEVFIGFAELLNLSGFAAIAQTILTAINARPYRAADIAALAIEDLKAGREAVLQGDAVGGQPSPALLDITAGAVDEPLAATDLLDDALDLDLLSDDALNGGLLDGDLLDGDLLDSDFFGGEPLDGEVLDIAVDIDALPSAPSDTPDLAGDSNVGVDLDASSSDAPEAEPGREAGDQHAWSRFILESASEPAEATSAGADGEDELALDLSDPLTGEALPQETFEPSSGDRHPGELNLEAAADSAVGDAADAAEMEVVEADAVEVDGIAADSVVADSVDQTSSSPPTAAKPSPKRRPSAKAIAPNLTVRVDTERLSRMNNLLGELTISRNGLELQNTQAQRGTRELQKRFQRFQDAVETIRSFSDQLLLRDQHPTGRRAPSNESSAASGDLRGDFDALEMDRYSTLYAQTQLLLEEIVQLEEAVEDVSLFTRQSGQMLGRHRKMLSSMQDELMWARMLPIGTLLNRFPRMLRDLSNQHEKPVRLQLTGADLLVDKVVLEKLYDPLLHLLRNGFDHGIEPTADRQQAGKPAEGQLSVTAVYRGRQVIIEVKDDGRGLNGDRIRQRAVQIGLLPESEAQQMSDQDLHELIFQPGFSTAAQVSDLSGRGVGLDVVREQVRDLNGRVSVASTLGQGTAFTLTLPLTLTVLNLLICFVGSTPLAFRSSGIVEVTIPKPGQTSQAGDELFLHWQGKTLRVYQMSDLLSYNCLLPETPPSRVLSAVPSPSDWASPMLIWQREKETIAIQVDRLVTEQELVVKPFGRAIAPPSYAYGCTVLGDGSLVPVIDGLVLLDSIFARYQDAGTIVEALEQAVRTTAQQDTVQITEAVTLLVIDDAVTSRRTLALSLERAGYRVLQARDGQEGVEQLGQNPDVQLIVCDVEMPVMNGFEFLTHRRKTPEITTIPTVMLTSRSNDKHRWLAKQLGATDYFTKPYLEQEFLKAIEVHLEATEEMAVVR